MSALIRKINHCALLKLFNFYFFQYKCTKACEKYRIGCSLENTDSHLCPNACYEECIKCEIGVKKRRTFCSHVETVPCNVNVDDVKCTKPCAKALPCGHHCKNKCYEPCGNCQVKVCTFVKYFIYIYVRREQEEGQKLYPNSIKFELENDVVIRNSGIFLLFPFLPPLCTLLL